jgi:lanosterol synthase
VLAELIEHMRGDLRTTDYAGLSPVNGLLAIISLWRHDPTDPDVRQALSRLDAWLWQDEQQGLRVAGALSSTWDTSFVIQALVAASPHVEISDSLRHARTFLASQQIRTPLASAQRLHRLDPTGGFCFGRVWHGWPISDCTAEALLALLDTAADQVSQHDLTAAVRFIFRCQNADGGFGSYEARRSSIPLEWLNPTEMFGDCMTEHSYVECTASCLAALRAFHQRHPALLAQEIGTAVARATRWLRRQQRDDGSWPGAWGIHFIYGTLFGIRGLLAAGAHPSDASIRTACYWLVQRQRLDGGWGEHFQGCRLGCYVEHDESQVIQTAWAMLALLEARAPVWHVLARAASFLSAMQQADGDWPQQDPAGVFFRTAPLDYTLYRSYFPVWALGLYESRRRERFNALPEVLSN